MVPAVFVPWAQPLLDAAGIRPGDRVLDVACATGTVARLASKRLADSGSVTGLDLSERWLDVARRAASAEGVRVDWRCGNAASLPFDSGSFDVVLCQQGIQFFDDREAALHEMHRVLAPRGRFGASVFRSIDESPGYRSLARALGRHVSRESEERIRGIFSLGDPEELRALMVSAGFQEIDVHPETGLVQFPKAEDFPHIYAMICEAAPGATEAVIRDVARELRDHCGPGGLSFPMQALIARGGK